MKDPKNIIIENYRPDLIFSSIINEIGSIHPEKESHELEESKAEAAVQQPTQSNESNLETKRLKQYIKILKGPKLQFRCFDNNEYKSDDSNLIGKGGQANVYKVYKDERKYFAKKEFSAVDFDVKELQYFLNESEVLFALQHPCILQIYAYNNGDKKNPPAMILSLEKESLEDAIKNRSLKDYEKCRIAVEIAIGMRFVHSRGFIHRDLKPSNILLSQTLNARISDFGLTRTFSQESMTKGVGTLRFMAPELLKDEDGDFKYDNSIDVYAYGIILYYIINGQYPPFNLIKVAQGVLPPMPSSIPNWSRKLIEDCLQFNAKDRPTFAQILDIMKSYNYNLFSDPPEHLYSKDRAELKEIENRISEIEAFEYQC